MAAASRGDVDAISSVVAEDVALYGDHGVKGRGVILRPIPGRANVARFFAITTIGSVLNPQKLLLRHVS